MNDDIPDEYSVGPLDHGTWLTLYHAIAEAIRGEREGDGVFEEEFRAAKDEFLAAHPEDAMGSPEDWPASMRDAWNETILEEIDRLRDQ